MVGQSKILGPFDLDTDVQDALSQKFALGCNNIAIQAVGLTGSHNTHVVKLLVSNDGTNFVDTSYGDIAQTGVFSIIAAQGSNNPLFAFGILKVTTPQGATSTTRYTLNIT